MYVLSEPNKKWGDSRDDGSVVMAACFVVWNCGFRICVCVCVIHIVAGLCDRCIGTPQVG